MPRKVYKRKTTRRRYGFAYAGGSRRPRTAYPTVQHVKFVPTGIRSSTGNAKSVSVGRGSSAFGRPSQSIQTGRLPFTASGFYRLPYSESFPISSNGTTGTSVVVYQYGLNAPYDPRTNLGGGQPIQWDQVASYYERYWCWGAKVTVTFSNPDYDGMLVGFRIRGSTNAVATSGLTIAEIKEVENTRSRWIHNTGNQTTVFKAYVRPWHILGITKAQYNNLEFSAQTSSVPTVQPILEPFALHSVAEQTATVRCTVRIVYYIQMTNKQTVLDA